MSCWDTGTVADALHRALGPCAAQLSFSLAAVRSSTSIVRSLAVMGGENSTTTTGDYWKTTDKEVAGQLHGQQVRGHQFKGAAAPGFSHLSARLAKQAWQRQNPATVCLAQNPMANPSVKGTGLRP